MATGLAALAGPACAADATWQLFPVTSDYHQDFNWNTGTTPFFGDTAFFGDTFDSSIHVLGGDVERWVFTSAAPDYEFTIDSSFDFYNGGIEVQGGSVAIRVQSGSLNFLASSAGSADITNDDDLFFSQPGASAGSGVITNNGHVLFYPGASGGTARFINNAAGTLDFAYHDNVIGSIEGAGAIDLGAYQLSVGINNLSTNVSGTIFGTGGSLVKVGTGTLTLSGVDKTYTGATTVTAGTLVVNTGLNGSGVIVGAGGRLGGTGTSDGTAAVNGVIAPGNSIGTINTGPITFGVGSIYEVEISPTQSDLINVTGTASLAGTVQVIAESGTYVPNTVYTILTSSGARSGTFDSVTDNLAFFAPVLSYDANNVYLTLATDFAAFGTTSNRSAAGSGLDGMTAPPYFDTLIGLTTDDIAVALDALSGEAHAAAKGAFLEQSTMIAGAALDRVDQAFEALQSAGAVSAYADTSAAGPAEAGARRIWGSPYGALGVIGADGNGAQTTSAAGGMVLGHDVELESGWTVGVLGGAGLSTVGARNASINSADFAVGLYSGAELEAGTVKVGAAYTRHQIASRRTVAFPGISEVMTADYAANTLQGFTEISRTFEHGAIDVTPFGRLDLVAHATDAFTETGGAGALSSAANLSGAAFTTLGLNVADSFLAGETTLVRAEAGLGWRHAFADAPSAVNSFAGGTPFTVTGASAPSDALALSGQVVLDMSESLNLALSYEGQLSTASASHVVALAAAGTY